MTLPQAAASVKMPQPTAVPTDLPRRRTGAVAVAIGIVAAVVTFFFSWVPSLWFDEAATIVSATRSWGSFFHEIRSVDAVSAVYYAIMHLWFLVVPVSPLSLRLPSSIATGVATMLVVLLADRLLGRTHGADRPLARFAGPIAGIVFLALPRVTWMGTEGRSYAFTAALAAGSTLVLVVALDRARRGVRTMPVWALFAIVTVVSGYVFVYSILLLASQVVTVLLILWMDRRAAAPSLPARDLRRFAGASLLSILLVAPLVLLASKQTGQISWIARPGASTVYNFFEGQWFTENGEAAVVGWLLLLAGAVVLVRRRRGEGGTILALLIPAIFLPAIALLVVSLVHTPLYVSRYVTFSAPAVAILTSAALAAVPIRFRFLTPIALVVVLGLSVPTYLAQRTEGAKDASNWQAVAATLSRQRQSESSTAAEVILYGPSIEGETASLRMIADGYPSAFAGMDDITAIPGSGALWTEQASLTASLPKVSGAGSVWLVTLTNPKFDVEASTTRLVATKGFIESGVWHFTGMDLVRYEPTPS
ncbi:glycosyltransferase family 39 protein [Frondihabitans cladoniiphilus]|uniref:Glycosyltransferase family 39 protein n=1 Tax=Frondihabitans cladoniiphilus TaxID=715785 RepID=A0ABP8VZ65_9MICO